MHVPRIEYARAVLVGCLLWLASPPTATADDELDATPEVDAARSAERFEVLLLDESLQLAVADTDRFRFTAGTLTAGAGAAFVALGIIRLIEDPGGNQLERGFSLLWLSLGATSLTTGLIVLFRKTAEERLKERWDARRASGVPLSEFELGTYVGELRAAADFRKRERALIRWTGLAAVGAGVLALALIPAAANLDDDSRRSLIIEGSVIAGFGLLSFTLSFGESGAETAWERYENSRRRRVRTAVVPAMFQRGAGVGVVGLF